MSWNMPTGWKIEGGRKFEKDEMFSLVCCGSSGLCSQGISVRLQCCNWKKLLYGWTQLWKVVCCALLFFCWSYWLYLLYLKTQKIVFAIQCERFCGKKISYSPCSVWAWTVTDELSLISSWKLPCGIELGYFCIIFDLLKNNMLKTKI